MLINVEVTQIVKDLPLYALEQLVAVANARIAILKNVELTDEEKAMASSEGMLTNAVKSVRARTGYGLKASVDAVKAYRFSIGK